MLKESNFPQKDLESFSPNLGTLAIIWSLQQDLNLHFLSWQDSALNQLCYIGKMVPTLGFEPKTTWIFNPVLLPTELSRNIIWLQRKDLNLLIIVYETIFSPWIFAMELLLRIELRFFAYKAKVLTIKL